MTNSRRVKLVKKIDVISPFTRSNSAFGMTNLRLVKPVKKIDVISPFTRSNHLFDHLVFYFAFLTFSKC